MNKVSDLKLALACHDAGIVPSLSIYSNTEYVIENKETYYNHSALNEVDEFMAKTGSNEISFAFHVRLLHSDKFFNRILRTKNRLIELLDWGLIDVLDHKILDRLTELQSQGRIVGLKFNNSSRVAHSIETKNIIDTSDYYILKGNEGAGMVGDATIDELTVEVKKLSSKKIVSTGGITSSHDVSRVLSLGADAVGIGTLFAMSEESRIPTDVKLKLLEKTKADLMKVAGTHQGIKFSDVPEHSNHNLDKSLVNGIETGQAGHINIGIAISAITEIRPIKDIVAQLVSELR